LAGVGVAIKTNRLRMLLSANVKARRKTLGISQEKLAELVNVSPKTITDIECCRSWVGDRTMSRLAEALGVEPFQLFVPQDSREDSAGLTTALMRLRQDIIADVNDSVSAYIYERFSRFLNSELPAVQEQRRNFP
jgi:transcriptional regulator with XRE-family HTH domain